MIGGLVAARAGFPEGDSVAALFVAALVVAAAARLIRRNVDVLMDRAPADAVAAAHDAIARLDPPVAVRRLRLRQAGGRSFADVVIGVSPGRRRRPGARCGGPGRGRVHRALPGSDVVVHVEPAVSEAELRERIRAAAMTVPQVRELHNLTLIDTMTGSRRRSTSSCRATSCSRDAHAIAEEVEAAIHRAAPEVRAVQTHLEPLAERSPGRVVAHDPGEIERAVSA